MSHQVAATRVILADPQVLFDIVADPQMHPVIDGSGTVKDPRGRVPDRLSDGATFGMAMRQGPAGYKILNTVVEFEEGRRIAWRHFNGHRWRYEFEPVDGATRVTETFDWSGARSKLVIVLAGFPSRNRRAMAATLERLDQVARERV
jgi:hypothetical protein